MLVLPAVFFSGENPESLPLTISKETTSEIPASAPALPGVLDLEEKAKATEQEEKIKKYCEPLKASVLDGDSDTGELPEAGFSVNIKNENLENLLLPGEKVKKYIYALLKEARSGYIRERIVREIYEGVFEPDELTTETLFFVLKDKSSQVRFLTAKILGERGSAKTIQHLNTLLYDPYSLRKDVYPVRQAAREAIELIKLREEAALLPVEERAKKWTQVIKDKAAVRQDYFCEQAAKELGLISFETAKEQLWQELLTAKDPQGKKTLVNNKIFGYLLLASAMMKDERTIPLIEDAFKETALMQLAARSAVALSFEQAAKMLLHEPVSSEKAELLLNLLKNSLAQNVILELSVNYPKSRGEEFKKYASLVLKKLLVKRDKEAYKEAANIFYYGQNDYALALEYLSLYENAAGRTERTTDEAATELFSLCLAAEGNLKRALEISPLMSVKDYLVNLRFLNLLALKETAFKKKTFRTCYYTAGAYLELKAYYLAAGVFKELLLLEDSFDLPAAVIQKKITFCEAKNKEQHKDIFTGIEQAALEQLKLEIVTEKQEYNTGEEIKLSLLLKNAGTQPVAGINDREGNLGFDLVILNKGRFLKRLKKDLSKIAEVEALEAGLFTIEPGSALASDLIALSAKENDTETELSLAVSYVPSPVLNGYEKGWIMQPVVSNELKIKIKK